MHWSRLLDGGLAGSMALVGLMLPSSRAELVVRTVWPVIWIFPAVISSLAIARNLGDRSAVFLTALLLAVDLSIYQQFLPGRIDHHDIQIVMALAAIACATAASQRTRWAIVAGAATGLGLGIGLEALAFQALVGANYALRLAGDRRQARSARAYGLTLAITSAAVFLVQTPPWRWSLSFCDALAFNSTCALVIAGLGIGVAAQAASRVSTTFRIGLIAFAGAAALGVYFTLDPHCLYGPFAEVDPTVRRLWLDRVQEVQSLAGVFWLDRPAAIGMGVILIMSFTAAMFLLVRAKCAPGTALALTLACLAFAGVMGIFVWRMTAYAAWFGLPVIGAAASYLAARRLNNRLLPSAAAILFLSPAVVSGAANAVTNAAKPDRSFAFREMRIQRCFAPAAFVQLQALPPGRVLSEPDIGPFILLFTRDSAFAAPYHRMWRAILASHGALDGPPGLGAPTAPPPPAGARPRGGLCGGLSRPAIHGRRARPRHPPEGGADTAVA
jgi:MFS family permease